MLRFKVDSFHSCQPVKLIVLSMNGKRVWKKFEQKKAKKNRKNNEHFNCIHNQYLVTTMTIMLSVFPHQIESQKISRYFEKAFKRFYLWIGKKTYFPQIVINDWTAHSFVWFKFHPENWSFAPESILNF